MPQVGCIPLLKDTTPVNTLFNQKVLSPDLGVMMSLHYCQPWDRILSLVSSPKSCPHLCRQSFPRITQFQYTVLFSARTVTDIACELKFICHPFSKFLTSSSSPTHPYNYKYLLISDPKYYSVVSLLSTLSKSWFRSSVSLYEINMYKMVDIEANYLAKVANLRQSNYMAYLIIFGFIIIWLIHGCVSCGLYTF